MMGFFSFLDAPLNFLLGWMLLLPTLPAVILISFLISLLIIIAYKYTTDQNLMKQLKDEMKALQQQMKELKEHPDKALEVQKKAMEANMKYMMQSFRATLYTMLPIIIIFGWLSAHLAFAAIAPGQEFAVELKIAPGTTGTVDAQVPDGLTLTGNSTREITDGTVIYTFKGVDEGKHTITFSLGPNDYTQDVMITKGKAYIENAPVASGGPIQSITVGLKKLVVLDLFGWELGWLGTYIIASIIFSIVLRKAFKVY